MASRVKVGPEVEVDTRSKTGKKEHPSGSSSLVVRIREDFEDSAPEVEQKEGNARGFGKDRKVESSDYREQIALRMPIGADSDRTTTSKLSVPEILSSEE
jgi:hypothetical protein